MVAVRLRSNSSESTPLPPPLHPQKHAQTPANLFHPSPPRRNSRRYRLQVKPPPDPPLFPSPCGRPAPPRCRLILGTGASIPPAPVGGLGLARDYRSYPGHRRPLPCLSSSASHWGSSKEEDDAQLAPSPCVRTPSVSCSRPGPAMLTWISDGPHPRDPHVSDPRPACPLST